MKRTARATVALALALMLASAAVAGSGQPPLQAERESLHQLSPAVVNDLIASARHDAAAPLLVANREIVVLRAAVVGRGAAERAAAAQRILEMDVDLRAPPVVQTRPLGAAAIIAVNGIDVLALVPLDADPLTGETVAEKARVTATRLQHALTELHEAQQPMAIVRSVASAMAMSALSFVLLWGLGRGARRINGAIEQKTRTRRPVSAVGDEIIRATNVLAYLRRMTQFAHAVLFLTATYLWIAFILRQFPYTRPWGESLRGFLLARLRWLIESAAGAIPDLFTVALIVLVMRVIVQAVRVIFLMAEEGRIQLPWVHTETAATTRKLVIGLLGAFALVVSYPYLPGSQTEAFKGVSVLLGLMISLGSTGVSNQVMSGFTLTYTRALRSGDFVKVGDIEGTVTHAGLLSTKIETIRREEITIPNAVVISQVVTNYSRFAESRGVYIPTQVTIGYDAPWRVVESLLLLAAARTSGLRSDPPPIVRQSALEDFFVRYTLLVCIDQPSERPAMLNELHAHIQDAFNEHGVQIMSPHYESDPNAPKIVPPDRWFRKTLTDSSTPLRTA